MMTHPRPLLICIFCVATLATASANAADKGAAKKGAKEITVSLTTKGDDIAFDRDKIPLKHGTGVIIVFKNAAKVGSEISHNIAVLKPGTTDEVLAAFEAADYEAEKIRGHKSILAMTPDLPPQGEARLPLSKKDLAKPGEYPYICLMPGHADALGMQGKFVVSK